MSENTYKPITFQELTALFMATITHCLEVMNAKNHDYTDGSTDPFANFRAANVLGIAPEIGILMRCMDKFQRITTWVNKGELHVKGEGVEDAIHDVINYMILLKGMIVERQRRAGVDTHIDMSTKPLSHIDSLIHELDTITRNQQGSTVWAFVERYYPRYESAEEIAECDDIQKILDNEYLDGDDADKLFKEKYYQGSVTLTDEMRATAEADRNALLVGIYERAIEGFLNKFAFRNR